MNPKVDPKAFWSDRALVARISSKLGREVMERLADLGEHDPETLPEEIEKAVEADIEAQRTTSARKP